MLNEPLGNLEVFDVLDLDAGAGDRILTINHHPTLIQETYCVDKKNATIYTELKRTAAKMLAKGIIAKNQKAKADAKL